MAMTFLLQYDLFHEFDTVAVETFFTRGKENGKQKLFAIYFSLKTYFVTVFDIFN